MLKADVAVSPGVAFGEFGEGFVRVGLVRMNKGLDKLQKILKLLI